MAICITGNEARLVGDWTLTGVTSNIDSLSLSLQQLVPGKNKDFRVDCGDIKDADVSGLQLLNVWLQCARFRGVEPMLVNVPVKLRHAMQVLVGKCGLDACNEAVVLPGNFRTNPT